MKQLLTISIVIAGIIFAACNNGTNNQKKNEMSRMNADSSKQTTASSKEVKEIIPSFNHLDPKASGAMKAIVSHYLHIKNALANDNSDEAANGAKAMSHAFTKVDKSFFTAEQKKVYEQKENDLKEHAEEISNSKLVQQREYFSKMSEDVYDLAVAFGGGQLLYHDHCPMASNGRGAMWLSETKEIKNPYMGTKMPACGSVEEKIQSSLSK